jgi:hypothetical protein
MKIPFVKVEEVDHRCWKTTVPDQSFYCDFFGRAKHCGDLRGAEAPTNVLLRYVIKRGKYQLQRLGKSPIHIKDDARESLDSPNKGPQDNVRARTTAILELIYQKPEGLSTNKAFTSERCLIRLRSMGEEEWMNPARIMNLGHY